jgi:hypothetical protein
MPVFAAEFASRQRHPRTGHGAMVKRLLGLHSRHFPLTVHGITVAVEAAPGFSVYSSFPMPNDGARWLQF